MNTSPLMRVRIGLRSLAATATVLLLSACASAPVSVEQMAVAEASVQSASSSNTSADAPRELQVATSKLAAARVLAELNARKTDRGMVVTLGDVLFDTGKSQLRPGGNTNLAKLAEFFKRNPERKAMVEGYTDNVGSAGMNLALSERRATAAMDALLGMGVTTTQLDTRAYGVEKPTADNATAAGRQMNRRVEIVFASTGADVASN